MVITLSIFYYLFLVAVGIFVLYSLFNLYHLLRFGFMSATNILIMIIYIIVASILLYYAFGQLLTVDWNQPLLNLNGIFDIYKNFFPKSL